MAALGLDEIESSVGEPVTSISLRSWPADFPQDVAIQRLAPHESRADSIMYRQVLAEEAESRGWHVHLYEASSVEQQATNRLGVRADSVLHGPRSRLGPPWNKDHRMALAATVLAGLPER